GGVRPAAPRDVPPADRLHAEQGGRAGVAAGSRGWRRRRQRCGRCRGRRGGGRRTHRGGVTPIYVGAWRVDPVVRDGVARPLPISVRSLGRSIASALDAAGAQKPASVGLILSGDRELATLNEAHLGQRGPTDVLSFPLLPAESFPPHTADADRGPEPVAGAAAGFTGPPGRRIHLGDIVVSVDRAIAQARARRWARDVKPAISSSTSLRTESRIPARIRPAGVSVSSNRRPS